MDLVIDTVHARLDLKVRRWIRFIFDLSLERGVGTLASLESKMAIGLDRAFTFGADVGAFREAEDIFGFKIGEQGEGDVLGPCKGRIKDEQPRDEATPPLDAVCWKEIHRCLRGQGFKALTPVRFVGASLYYM